MFWATSGEALKEWWLGVVTVVGLGRLTDGRGYNVGQVRVESGGLAVFFQRMWTGSWIGWEGHARGRDNKPKSRKEF